MWKHKRLVPAVLLLCSTLMFLISKVEVPSYTTQLTQFHNGVVNTAQEHVDNLIQKFHDTRVVRQLLETEHTTVKNGIIKNSEQFAAPRGLRVTNAITNGSVQKSTTAMTLNKSEGQAEGAKFEASHLQVKVDEKPGVNVQTPEKLEQPLHRPVPVQTSIKRRVIMHHHRKSQYNFLHNYTQDDLLSPVLLDEYPNITLEYVPMNCQRPQLLPGYRNPCWVYCKEGCMNLTADEAAYRLRDNKAEMICGPRVVIMGIRKSGTSDLWAWLKDSDEIVDYNIDFDIGHFRGLCGTEHVLRHWRGMQRIFQSKFRPHPTIYMKNTFLLDAPGQILYHYRISNEGNHFKLNHALQLFQEFEIPESRYILSLRDPTERAISQLYEWHGHKDAFHNWEWSEVTPEIVHNITAIQIQRLKTCFKKHGPKGCIFMTPAVDGPDNFDAQLLWGLYIEYLEEAFKFLDRSKWVISKLSEYSADEIGQVKKIFSFIGIPYQNKRTQEKRQVNKRRKPNIWPETREALQAFYKPFNERLAIFLNDKKWLFS